MIRATFTQTMPSPGCISDARTSMRAWTCPSDPAHRPGVHWSVIEGYPFGYPLLYLLNEEASFEPLGAAILWGDIQNAPEVSQVVSVPAYGCYNAGQ